MRKARDVLADYSILSFGAGMRAIGSNNPKEKMAVAATARPQTAGASSSQATVLPGVSAVARLTNFLIVFDAWMLRAFFAIIVAVSGIAVRRLEFAL
jgi:hypothetical protein